MKKLLLIIFLFATVTAFGQYNVYHGEEFTATATPNPGFVFVGWYEGETLISTDNPYTWGVTESVNLTAKFERIMLQININVQPPGAGTVTTNIIGDLLQIEAKPSFFHNFKHWETINGIRTENPLLIEDKPVNITAVFKASLRFLWVFVVIGIVAIINLLKLKK